MAQTTNEAAIIDKITEIKNLKKKQLGQYKALVLKLINIIDDINSSLETARGVHETSTAAEEQLRRDITQHQQSLQTIMSALVQLEIETNDANFFTELEDNHNYVNASDRSRLKEIVERGAPADSVAARVHARHTGGSKRRRKRRSKRRFKNI